MAGQGTPGPGTYDHSKNSLILRNPATARIGTSVRQGLFTGAKDVPGPQSYNQNATVFYAENTPRTVFGTSQRQPISTAKQQPGPGEYSIQSRAIEGR